MHYQLAGPWFIINVHEPRQRKRIKTSSIGFGFYNVGLLFQTIRLIKFMKSLPDDFRSSKFFFIYLLIVFCCNIFVRLLHVEQSVEYVVDGVRFC